MQYLGETALDIALHKQYWNSREKKIESSKVTDILREYGKNNKYKNYHPINTIQLLKVCEKYLAEWVYFSLFYFSGLTGSYPNRLNPCFFNAYLT